MKLAIMGSSPIALEAALRFHHLGAGLTWFNPDEIEFETFFQSFLPGNAYTTPLGLQILEENQKTYIRGEKFDFHFWKENYFNPLVEFIGREQKIRSHEVVSMTKRYLSINEVPEGKSRFLDLFRIIYQVNPQEFIKEQKESNPQAFERLTKELVDSLQSNLEMYEDFDLVLDLRRPTQGSSLSITGRALGESRVSADHIKYGFEGLKMAQEINQDAQDVREVALVGSGAMAAQTLLFLEDWLRDERSRLFIVSEELNPFEKFLNQGDEKVVSRIKNIFDGMDKEFEMEINEFHQKLRHWQELDDFVQAKIPRPVEPIPRLVYFSGHNATSVDQLIDKRRLFLTLERPDFRRGLKHPENNILDLKTIGLDRIIVMNRLHPPHKEIQLADDEVGHFILVPDIPNLKDAWQNDLNKLKGIEHEIFNLFSPAGPSLGV